MKDKDTPSMVHSGYVMEIKMPVDGVIVEDHWMYNRMLTEEESFDHLVISKYA